MGPPSLVELTLTWTVSYLGWAEPPSPARLVPDLVRLESVVLLGFAERDGLVGRLGPRSEAEAWRPVPRPEVAALPRLLEAAGAFDDPLRLVEGNETGDYPVAWQLSGAYRGEPFLLELDFMAPGERWSPVGQPLCNALHRLAARLDGTNF